MNHMQEDKGAIQNNGLKEQSSMECSWVYDMRTEMIIAGAILVIIVGLVCLYVTLPYCLVGPLSRFGPIMFAKDHYKQLPNHIHQGCLIWRLMGWGVGGWANR